MPLAWSDDLLLGRVEIDRQHRELVALTAALQGAIEAGLGEIVLSQRQAALAECAAAHFATEEGLMLATGYPGYDEHRREHQRLLDQLRVIRDNLATRDAGLLVTLLSNWTVSHICFADKQLAAYLNKSAFAREA